MRILQALALIGLLASGLQAQTVLVPDAQGNLTIDISGGGSFRIETNIKGTLTVTGQTTAAVTITVTGNVNSLVTDNNLQAKALNIVLDGNVAMKPEISGIQLGGTFGSFSVDGNVGNGGITGTAAIMDELSVDGNFIGDLALTGSTLNSIAVTGNFLGDVALRDSDVQLIRVEGNLEGQIDVTGSSTLTNLAVGGNQIGAVLVGPGAEVVNFMLGGSDLVDPGINPNVVNLPGIIGNTAPYAVATADPQQASPGTTINLDGSYSGDAESPVTYLWTLTAAPAGHAPAAGSALGSGPVAWFVATLAGSYSVRLRVTDAVGFIADAYVTIEIAAAAQELLDLSWAVRAGGASPCLGRAIAAFPDGSLMVTGDFQGRAVFGPGEAAQTTLVAKGGQEIFVARYFADGRLDWARRAGSIFDDEGVAIAALSDGGAVVAGRFGSWSGYPADFGGLSFSGGNGVFVARYRVDGSVAWAREARSASARASAVAACADGDLLVAGSFSQDAGDAGLSFDGQGITAPARYASSVNTMFLVRYRADGSLDWARAAGGENVDAQGLSLAADGGVMVCGGFSGRAEFGWGEAGAATLLAAGSTDIFIARYGAAGALLWARRAGGAQMDIGVGLAALRDGSSVLTGRFTNPAVFGLGEAAETTLRSQTVNDADAFIARYAPDGRLMFVRRISSRSVATGIAAVSDGSAVVVAGHFSGGDVFGAGEAGAVTLWSAGSTVATRGTADVFVARYRLDGSLARVKQGGGTGRDEALGVALFADGSSVVTGRYTGTAIFGAGEAGQTSLISGGWDDLFVARLTP